MMRYWFTYCILLGYLFCLNPVLGSDTLADSLNIDKKLIKKIKKADQYFDAGPLFYPKALEKYKAINEEYSNSNLPSYKLGIYYVRTTGNTENAITHLSAAITKGYDKPDIYYYLGKAYQQKTELDSALIYFEKYKSFDIDSIALLPVERRITEVNAAKKEIDNPKKVILQVLGDSINSENEDYAVFVTNDRDAMYYTSRRPNTSGRKLTSFDGLYFEDTYVSNKIDNNWSQSESLPNRINKKTNDAIIGLSLDGQSMFIYRDVNGGDILLSELHNTDWGKPKAIKEINTRHHESSACYSVEQNAIYFISDRPGGYGGKDIYVSVKNDDGIWLKPKNMGNLVNTPYDETTVFIHPIGDELYFSSKGHSTMGGYDIFKAKLDDNGKPIEVENMGYPINTIGDDISFITSIDNKKAFYATQGTDMNDKDIVEITFLGEEITGYLSNNDDLLSTQNSSIVSKMKEPKIVVREKGLTIIKGVIRDATTGEFIEAVIEVVDNEEFHVVSTFRSNGETGKFLIPLKSGTEYGITIRADNYMFYSENRIIKAVEGVYEIKEDIELNHLEVGSSIVLNNIFFDHDKADLKNKSILELERIGELLEENKHLEVEISGHTDSNGSAEYNVELSKRRAQAVVDYLVVFGIDINRMKSAGYGLTKPIASNETSEGRALNRRTEFAITGIEFRNNR